MCTCSLPCSAEGVMSFMVPLVVFLQSLLAPSRLIGPSAAPGNVPVGRHDLIHVPGERLVWSHLCLPPPLRLNVLVEPLTLFLDNHRLQSDGSSPEDGVDDGAF